MLSIGRAGPADYGDPEEGGNSVKLKQDFGVRALIAILLIVGVFVLAGYLAVRNRLPSEVLTVLVSTISTLAAFYFGARTKA